ncbi:hypothetical protein SEPCBS119000_002765 [Sporothrix epigloea]|uniref:3-dehydroquinate dehydratase I n=1 Tax=Sporothrix epigloea TaxID=1892477 RepID=A0ABP0DHY7_9PEZI
MAAIQQMPPVSTGISRLGVIPVTSESVPKMHDMGDIKLASDAATAVNLNCSLSGLAIENKSGIGPRKGDTRIAVVIYNRQHEEIVPVFAEVLGKPFCTRPSFQSITIADKGLVIGIDAENAKSDIISRNQELVVAINVHCTSLGMPPDSTLSEYCDYEFLFTSTPFFRRDLSRFVSFTLGQINHHQALMEKPRTYYISTTFPDVRVALPNIDILTVGSDAVEIRVDLLKEPLGDGSYAAVPSLAYVGEQVMMLRQRTELPIILTTRCQNENGTFPMDDPNLYYRYLRRAMQWGVEYIDVELWLPEAIRKRLYEQRGNSRIMSAYHDLSGTLKWATAEAQSIYVQSCKYADIVKMIANTNDRNENFEVEYFRSKIRAEYPSGAPLSAVNMGEMGQFSRMQNHVFSPITHPLLPIIAAPGQMSAAGTNAALSMLGQLPPKIIYGIANSSSQAGTPQAPFYMKCFNELGLPHQFAVVEQQLKGPNRVDMWCNQRNFGGAYLHPALSYSSLIHNSGFFSSLGGGNGPILSSAARVIGIVDTIIIRPSVSAHASPEISAPSTPHYHPEISNGHGQGGLPPSTQLVFDNASWRGILSTLTRDLAPSAYFGRTAVVLASSSDDAASAIFALGALRISKIYTVGFKTPPALAGDLIIEPFNSLESLQKVRTVSEHDESASPFLIVSALSPKKGNLVGLLLRVFGSTKSGPLGAAKSTAYSSSSTRKVFLNLAADAGINSYVSQQNDPCVVAEQSGFAVYGSSDVNAFTTVETLRLLVGQNVPYNFVRLASGRSPF